MVNITFQKGSVIVVFGKQVFAVVHLAYALRKFISSQPFVSLNDVAVSVYRYGSQLFFIGA